MIKAIVLTCGFAEGQQLGFVPFVNTTSSFKTKEAAAFSLAECIFQIYYDHFYPEFEKECCGAYITNEKFKYCPECSTQLQNREQPYWEEFASYILQICKGELHQSEVNDLEEYGWTTGVSFSELCDLKKSEIVVIEESAEKVLAKLALGIKDGEEEI